jgi:predicted dehydrogenase
MKALVVGLGSIGRRHARNWAALGLGEVLVCREHGSPQPQPLGLDARVFTDLDAALAERPDVVLVTNPTSLHVATAQRAIAAGAHALVEKPLGAALDGVADLLRVAQDKHRVLAVGYNLRFHPSLARLRELARGGAIGRPLSARAEVGEYLPDWHPWEDYRRSYVARRDLGGGVVLTLSHDLDALCWVLGRPTCVLGLAERSGVLEVETEDVAEIVLRFANGAVGSVHLDMLRRPAQRFLEVSGEAGVLRWEYDANRLLQYAPAARAWRVEEGAPTFVRNDMYLAELRSFADGVAQAMLAETRTELSAAATPETPSPPRQAPALATPVVSGEAVRPGSRPGENAGLVEPLADGRQGAAVLAVALAALRASAEGRAVDLSAEEEPVAGWLASL